ncbi:MAG: D-alanyl-D-alanine carboxypeptidase [Lachnospiraceae bacterium]
MKRGIRNIISFVTAGIIILGIASVSYGEESIKVNKDGNESEALIVEGMPEIVAEGAIVVDVNTGYTLYEKNIYTKYYPASITKIMTATLSLENLKYEDIVTFSHDAVFSIEPGSSAGYLNEGEQITVEQCLYGLMLISGNDIANGLAETVAGTMDSFARMMTEKAKALGCINTNFTNAHGLHDENHYTCPYDMAVIARNAYMNLEQFRTLISTVRAEIPPTAMCNETRYWLNSNRMIQQGTAYYDGDCLGGKTGFTDQAGGTLVTFHNINNRTVMIVIMKDTNSVGAYTDTKLICDYLHEKLNAQYIEKLDNAYTALKEKESESDAQFQVSNNSKDNIKAETTKKAEEKDNGGGSSFPVGVKVLLVVVLVAVIYYFIISVQRNNKRRRKSRTKTKGRAEEKEIDIIKTRRRR